MSDIVDRLRHPTLFDHMTDFRYQQEVAGRAANEIERLQQEKDQAVRAMAEMRKKMHDQEDRIEELDGKLTMQSKALFDESCEWFKDKHIITTAQIDAAWKLVSFYEQSQFEDPVYAGIVDGVIAALKELGIEGCEDWLSADTRGDVCPDCDGHGWVKICQAGDQVE
jgi:hypothetical protein